MTETASQMTEFLPVILPLVWAATQNNLGNALLRLGERESGTARLHDAVTAYREALKNLPVSQIYVKDTEADDVIGYICRYKFPESNIVVISSDKDLYQLINHRVTQWSLNQKKLVDRKDRKSTRLNSSHMSESRMPSSA